MIITSNHNSKKYTNPENEWMDDSFRSWNGSSPRKLVKICLTVGLVGLVGWLGWTYVETVVMAGVDSAVKAAGSKFSISFHFGYAKKWAISNMDAAE